MRSKLWFAIALASKVAAILPVPIFRLFWRVLDMLDGKVGAILRYVLVSRRLLRCGTEVYFGPLIVFDDVRHIEIGDNVSIHHGCTFLARGGIRVGSNVSIAHGCSIVSGNHSWVDSALPIRKNPVVLSQVRIDDDVWIGCGVRILAGVHIGTRVVIAAGAVVNGGCNSGWIYGGVPSKAIKEVKAPQ